MRDVKEHKKRLLSRRENIFYWRRKKLSTACYYQNKCLIFVNEIVFENTRSQFYFLELEVLVVKYKVLKSTTKIDFKVLKSFKNISR